MGDELQIICTGLLQMGGSRIFLEGAKLQDALTYSGDRAGRQGNAGGPCCTCCVQADAEHFTNAVQGSYTSSNKPKTSNVIHVFME